MSRQTKNKQQPKYSVGDIIRIRFGIEELFISMFQGQIGIILKVEKMTKLTYHYKILLCGIPDKSFTFDEDEISGKVEDERKE